MSDCFPAYIKLMSADNVLGMLMSLILDETDFLLRNSKPFIEIFCRQFVKRCWQ